MRYFLIPARGGSKGVTDKNIRDLGGRPMIDWTIRTARAAFPNTPLVVNSEDSKILDISEGLGAQTYRRPEYLAGDESCMRDVVKNFFDECPDCHEVVLLFPCCPFRTVGTLRRAVEFFQFREGKSLMSVTPFTHRPFGGVQIVDGKLGFNAENEAFFRKQETPVLYRANGAIFIMTREELPNLNTQLFNADTIPFVMDEDESLDIDTEHDMRVAQALVSAGYCASNGAQLVALR